jgi:hypothetical protein
MDHSIHEEHVFQRMDKIVKVKTAHLLDGVTKLEKKIADFKAVEKELQDNLDEIKQKKDAIVQKIQAPIEIETNKITGYYEKQIGPLMAEKAKVTAMISEMQQAVNVDIPVIWSLSKTEFLRKFVVLNQRYTTFAKYSLPKVEKLNVEFAR